MTISGLDHHERVIARERFVQAAFLALHHAPAIHYTQLSPRWQGIAQHKIARLGHYPTEADCSAMFSWWSWNALLPFLKRLERLHHGTSDIINGAHWEGGYTGTLADHGREVIHLKNTLRADAVLYGSAPRFEHVAGIVGHRVINGHRIPMVVSHGSEAGPLFLPYNYRPDVGEIRRYI